MKSKIHLTIITLFFVTLIPPAHAYAGPGVAIGAVLVALTVILAFFGSLVIRIFNLIKNIFKFLKRKISTYSNSYKNRKSNKQSNFDQ